MGLMGGDLRPLPFLIKGVNGAPIMKNEYIAGHIKSYVRDEYIGHDRYRKNIDLL